ncbi:MAG: protein phosphatase 2C domain-containing protein [Chloroflexota bacterium]
MLKQDLLHYEQVTGEKIILDARSELTQLDQTLPVEDEEHNKHHYLEAMATTRPLADRPANDELFKPHKAFGQFRDQGMVRSNNQDAVYSFLSIQDSLSDILNFGLFIVADGMGGHSEGEKASDMTISVIAQEILNRAYLPLLHGVDMNDVFSALSDIIIGAIQTANSRVRSDVADASSTATVAVLFNNYLYLGHVGDTRAYLIKDDSIEQISRDHSLVMRLMELGQITPEEAETHVQRNVLYRVIGQNENVEVDILTRLVPNARLLLCSDGLWDMLDDETIADVVRSEPHPQIACNKLVKMANNNGGKDNISVILIQTF